MKTSGKVAVKMDCENPADVIAKGVAKELPDGVHKLLLEVYKSKVPRFQELCKRYEEEMKRARNRRQKSSLLFWPL